MTARSANAEPTLYLRADLQWQHRRVFGRDRWVVRDPLTLRFFYLSEPEYQITKLLDRPRRMQTIIAEATALGGLSEMAVRKLLLALSKTGLLRAVKSSATPTDFQQPRTSPRSKFFTGLTLPLRLLVLKIPLGDPTRSLQRTAWAGRLLFNRTMLWGLGGLWLLLGLLAALRWDRIITTLPELPQALGWQALALFLAAYVLLKSCHEISHAMACQRFGAECHEVGILMLCFTPCFYCDVTDSWRIQQRLRRAGIGAAGVYAELWVAALAGLVWMFSAPGLLQAICFSLFVIGSLGTVLINSNPLLRYDGYYVLSDLCNVPNLAQQARQACWSTLRQVLSKSAGSPPTLDAPRFLLVLYNLLSWTYRIMILGIILWSLDYFFAALRIAAVGRLLVLVLLAALVLQTGLMGSMQIRQLWRHPAVSRLRLVGLLILLVAAAWCLVATPFQYDMGATGFLSIGKRTPVYAGRGGLLIDSVADGAAVEPGDQLFRLHSTADALRMAELESTVQQLQKKLEWLETLGGGSIEGAASRETLSRLLDSLRSQLATARLEWESLVGRSPGGGVFLAAEVNQGHLANRATDGDASVHLSGSTVAVDSKTQLSETLGRWRRKTTDPTCLGRLVRRGELFGWIVDDGAWHVDALVPERQVERVRVGAKVRARLADQPWIERTGVVDSIGREPTASQAETLGESASWPSGNGYLLRIRLEQPLSSAAPADSAQTDQIAAELRIETQPESLAVRFRRFLTETVRW